MEPYGFFFTIVWIDGTLIGVYRITAVDPAIGAETARYDTTAGCEKWQKSGAMECAPTQSGYLPICRGRFHIGPFGRFCNRSRIWRH